MSKANIKNGYWQTLLQVGQEINSLQKVQSILEKILDLALQQLSAERGFVLLRDEKDNTLLPRATRYIDPSKISDISQISQSAVDKVINTGTAVLTYDTGSDDNFDTTRSIILHRICSIACVPLILKGELIGAIYIDSQGQKARLSEQSLEFLVALANQAAIAIENARFMESLKDENESLRVEIEKNYSLDEIIGTSRVMQPVTALIQKVLNNDTTLLITGETGTGKELVARVIHHNGSRKKNKFIAVNCASIPENLLESELFGYRKGAFTGASKDKKGLLEEADYGTIFLDEIAELPFSTQSKLLRFLQDHEILRLGDTRTIKLNVRIIAATNKNIKKEVETGKFREDLYYRLNIINIHLPPLRERSSDIPILANHFLKKYCFSMGKKFKGFTDEGLRKLEEYIWPGNVRELENALERSVILASGQFIEADDIKLDGLQMEDTIRAGMKLEHVSKILLQKTLSRCKGNKTKVADMLGVSLRWVHYKMKEWDLK